jgi:hypothetical protein
MSRARLAVAACLLLAGAAAGSAGAQPAKLALPSAKDGPLGPREAEPPIVEVLTFGVGDRIFEKYGHAAVCLRYHDPRNPPICFNYGVTSFGDGPILIWRFLRSAQRFWAEPTAWGEPWAGGAGRPRGMIGFYTWEDRDIWSQRLPLTGAEARAIETRIWDSLREDRRYYFYDHFYDNCTTRLRDMIDEVTGGKLRAGTDAPYPLTFRELGRRGLAELPPLLVLSDFVMGRQLEDTPTVWDAMFHPDVLRRELELRLGAAPVLVYQRRGAPFPTDGSSGRLQMLAIGLVLALPLLVARGLGRLAHRAARRLGLGAAAVALVRGLLFALGGVLLWLGWTTGAAAVSGVGVLLVLGAIAMSERAALIFATVHLVVWGLVVWTLVAISSIPGVRWNEVVLVLVPFDVVLPFLGEARRRRYAAIRVAGLLLVSALRAAGVLVQPLWVPILVAFMPLAVIAFDLPRALWSERCERRAAPDGGTVAP